MILKKISKKEKTKKPIFMISLLIGLITLTITAFIILRRVSIKCNDVISIGFETDELQADEWIGITSAQRVINVGDDLAVNVYYGTTLNYPDDYLIKFQNGEVVPSSVVTKLAIKYGLCTIELLGEEDYTINSITTDKQIIKVIEEFGAAEYPRKGIESKYDTIIITSDYFNESMGFICFTISEYGVYNDAIDMDNIKGVGASIYYIVEKDTIKIFGSTHDFYNYLLQKMGK